MKPVMMLVTIVIVAILIAVVALLVQNKRKEKYTNATLGPLLSSPNEETYDVLQWSLGGFGGSPRKSC